MIDDLEELRKITPASVAVMVLVVVSIVYIIRSFL